MTTLTSTSASVGIEGIVYIFLGDGVSRGRDEWQLSLALVLILEAPSETLEQFLLLRYRQRIYSSFNLRERVHEQRLALAGRELQAVTVRGELVRRGLSS